MITNKNIKIAIIKMKMMMIIFGLHHRMLNQEIKRFNKVKKLNKNLLYL